MVHMYFILILELAFLLTQELSLIIFYDGIFRKQPTYALMDHYPLHLS
jgi:hypothetical protein